MSNMLVIACGASVIKPVRSAIIPKSHEKACKSDYGTIARATRIHSAIMN